MPEAESHQALNEARRERAIEEASFFDSADGFRSWMADGADHDDPEGIWLRIANEDAGIDGGTLAEAIDETLAFGWVHALEFADEDPRCTLHRFTPRGPRASWSQADRDRTAELIEAGRAAPRGIEAFERAKADGRLDAAYAAPAELPADFAAALEARPEAKAFFATVDERNHGAILHKIQAAPDAETRARRIATFVDMLASGEKLYPRRPKRRPAD